MRKIGINMHAMKGLTDEDYIIKIAELGFSATFTGVWEQGRQSKLADLCAKHGIEYETIHAPFGHINDIWADTDDGEAMLDELKACVDRCVTVGAGIAVVHLSSGVDAPPVTDIGRARFAKLVEYAAMKNISIAFENQRKLANLAWALETFGAADPVGFCWDCGHEGCFTPGRQYMPLFSDRLICTHIHDNYCIYNDDKHMLPFDGNLDFDRVAQQLADSPFNGTLMLETMAHNSNYYDQLNVDEYLRRAATAACRFAEMVEDK